MEMSEVLEVLADGHVVLTEESARQMCEVMGVSFPERSVMRWTGRDDAMHRYGFMPYEDAPGTGVGSLELSYHVAKVFGLGTPGGGFIGKGSQAQANVQAIARKLGL